jgi:hypothetical protein
MKQLVNIIDGALKGAILGIVAGIAAAYLAGIYAQYQDSSNFGGGVALGFLPFH